PDANSSTLNPTGACGTVPAGRATVRGKFEADGEAPGGGKCAGVMWRQTPGASARQSPKAAGPVSTRLSWGASCAGAVPASAIESVATTITGRIDIRVSRLRGGCASNAVRPAGDPYIRLLQKRQKHTNIGSTAKTPGRRNHDACSPVSAAVGVVRHPDGPGSRCVRCRRPRGPGRQPR